MQSNDGMTAGVANWFDKRRASAMTIPGPTVTGADDVCLFAHFDRDDRVDDHVFRYLEALQTTGFRIVFVTASQISSSDRQRLGRMCDDVIARENRGSISAPGPRPIGGIAARSRAGCC